MMSSRFLLALAAATVTLAATPQGFEPASRNDLVVDFGRIAATNGLIVAKEVTQRAPTISTKERLTGSSYAIMMIDLDIPTDNPPQTGTLLHWMQTGLTPAQTPTLMNTTSGRAQVFMLQMSQTEEAVAPYFGPSPPARFPLSHRYTELLVDTSSISTEGANVLRNAATNRRGFLAQDVLQQAGLTDKVVAGNFFNVTNPGPVSAAGGGASGGVSGGSNFTTGTGSGSGSTNGGTGFGNAVGTGSLGGGSEPSTTGSPVTASAIKRQAGGLFAGLAAVGVVFLAL